MAEDAEKGPCVHVCILLIIGVCTIIWCSLWKESACDKFSKRIQEECSNYSPPANAQLRRRSFYDEVRRRCSLYSPPPDAPLRLDKDCNKIAEAFTNAVASKDPCYITAEDYLPLMELVNQEIPTDKVLLWSKTQELKEQYMKAGGKLLTQEHMLVSHIADNLMWCGNKGSSEVKYGLFREENGICPLYPTRVFWEVAAKWFAENNRGQVHVLLNGSSSESVAYNETSVFRCAEVPNLSLKVTELHAWVICDCGVNVRDSCSGASIKQLELDLRRYVRPDIVFTCEDMDRETFLQRVKNYGSSQSKSVLWNMIGVIRGMIRSIAELYFLFYEPFLSPTVLFSPEHCCDFHLVWT
ncbi:ADP-ribosyl cyclase/cyclic ADP-ribose hydrolase 1-like [Talpa occidentalis]|uniref:ADP-ribosyl cyclase/cyclic ADP-ribose hydrolase 1-like n=1 Tax=Talpa occidentalis TaxID=50954 RepID=UPI00188F7162|nr:ADP-ribosyl cyclase/cyclic ADP-ribose hydrolase 1-like [Talpa occidentalis]